MFTPITAAQTDAESPLDQTLMDAIRLNLDDLDARVTAFGGDLVYDWNLNGNINLIPFGDLRRLDGLVDSKSATFTQVRGVLEHGGASGQVEFDIRKYNPVRHAIKTITRQYEQSIDGIAVTSGGSSATQSITRVTANISTQSITRHGTTINVDKVILLPDDEVLIYLQAAVDADWVVGESIEIAGHSQGGNNGIFPIVRIQDEGGDQTINVVVTNASGVEDTVASGTAQSMLFSYNFLGAVDTVGFKVGEGINFTSHTSSANDGFALGPGLAANIRKINSGGNNIVVFNASGVTQGGVAGTTECRRLSWNFSSAAPTDLHIIGETSLAAGHSSGTNDGALIVKAINQSGDNIVALSASSVAIVLQAGVAGTWDTLFHKVALPADPTGSISVGDKVNLVGTVSFDSESPYDVKELNRDATDNIIIKRASTQASGGTVGDVFSTLKVVEFHSDKSTDYTVDESRIEIDHTDAGLYDGDHTVVEINRGAGNNVVIDVSTVDTEQDFEQGHVAYESKSLFTTRPIVAPTLAIPLAEGGSFPGTQITNTPVFGSEAAVASGDLLGLDIISRPTGAPGNLRVTLF